MPNRGSWVEINLAHVRHNLCQIQARSGARLILPVKADAYGHGAVRIAQTAVECGVDFFCVANIGEAQKLREAWVTQKILLIVPLVLEDCEAILTHHLRPTLSNLEVAHRLSELAQRQNSIVKVHLEVDTGMSRGGVWYQDFFPFYRTIATLPGLEVEGLYTHFASADEGDLFFTQEQQRRFQETLSRLQTIAALPPVIHSDNSAAVLQLGSSALSHVRPGISVYGYYPSASIQASVELKPVMSCKTSLVHIHHLEKGRSVSYNRKYFAKQDTRVGVIDIGYADGFSRLLSNKGQVLIRGKKTPVIGSVCMDMLMVDLAPAPEAQVNDEAVILGEQNGERITADDIAREINTINYEVVTLLGTLNKKLYLH